jgi:hypothetical protein
MLIGIDKTSLKFNDHLLCMTDQINPVTIFIWLYLSGRLIAMPSLTTVTIQSALLKSAANLTVQAVARWNSSALTPFDWARVAEFASFGIVSAPLASYWQIFLEETLPSQKKSPEDQNTTPKNLAQKTTQGSKPSRNHLNWSNIMAKLILDQTIGQLIINVAFLVCTRGRRLASFVLLLREIQTSIPGIIWASWKIWPVVALVNFIWVPVDWRVVVASVVGFGWNIFLSILSMQNNVSKL